MKTDAYEFDMAWHGMAGHVKLISFLRKVTHMTRLETEAQGNSASGEFAFINSS